MANPRNDPFFAHFGHLRRGMDSLFDDVFGSAWGRSGFGFQDPHPPRLGDDDAADAPDSTAIQQHNDTRPGGVVPFGFGLRPSMSVDLHEDDAGYQLTADCPGCGRDDVKVQVHDGVVTITAQRKDQKEEKSDDDGRTYHRIERSSGMVSRSLRLPPGADEAHVRARVQNGVVSVSIPKLPDTPKVGPREVPIDEDAE